MACYSCHSAWVPTCFGCHLEMTANQKMPMLHNEGLATRNWTAFNFQILRDDIYMLGVDGTVTGNRIAPVRSACAVLVRVLRANQYRTGGPHGCDAITGDGAVDAEHVDVVAQNVEVVGGPILGGQPLVMQHRHLLVCGHLKMTGKAGRDPCGVIAYASHREIVMCERTYIVAAPGGAVLLDGFREAGLLVVVRVSGGNGILDLNDFPLLAWIHHGALEETIIPGVKLPLAPWGAKDLQVRAAFGRCRPRGHQGSASGDTTVAIDAVDLNGVASLSVQLSIPVSILGEMSVNAMHSFFEVNVLEMHGPAEFVGILGRDDIVLFIEQIALAILLVNRAEYPPVAMKIGKLGVLKRFRELWAADFFKEANIGP